jgi:hypothetical protein
MQKTLAKKDIGMTYSKDSVCYRNKVACNIYFYIALLLCIGCERMPTTNGQDEPKESSTDTPYTLSSLDQLNRLAEPVINADKAHPNKRISILVASNVQLTGKIGDREFKGVYVLDTGWYRFEVNPAWPDELLDGNEVTIIGKLYWNKPHVSPESSAMLATREQPGEHVEGIFSLMEYEVVVPQKGR